MSCSPGATSGDAPRSWLAVRAQPAVLAPRDELRRGRARSRRRRARRGGATTRTLQPARARRSAPGSRAPTGTASPPATCVGFDRELAGPRARASSTKPSPSTPTRTSDQPSAVRSTTRNGRLSSSSLARTTPSAGPRGARRATVAIGPMPATATRRVVVGAFVHDGPSASSTGSSASSVALLGAAARRSARRARSAARGAHRAASASTSAARRPRPAPASTTKNGSGPPSSSHQPSSAPRHQRAEQRADLGAGDEVAAGAAGAVRAGEEAAVAVERVLDERVERDRPFPMDPLRDPFARRRCSSRKDATDPSDRR